MANFECEFYSNVLDCRANFNVMLPEACTEDVPVVFLLHGLSGNHNDWQRLTSVNRYAKEREIALVVPNGGKSFYCDMKHGDQYASYIGGELLEYTRKVFPISKKRETTFIAGMSMGGYGTMKLALSNPQNYAACAAFAGTMSIQENFQRPERRKIGAAIWGEEGVDRLSGSDDDLYELVRRLEEAGNTDLRIYHGCGTEDPLYPQNAQFRTFMEKSSFSYEYHERPGGHTWDVWDYFAEKSLDFFVRYMKETGLRP